MPFHAVVYAALWWDWWVQVPVRGHKELAEGLGWSVSVVRRVCQELQERKLVRFRGRGAEWRVELVVPGGVSVPEVSGYVSVVAEGVAAVSKGAAAKPVKPLPSASAEFRKFPMAAISADPHYAIVADLHAEWCAVLGVEFALNPWRYAAWRTALVEQNYTPDQLRDAFPRVAKDPWAMERMTDPHVMFTGNASKIERYFRDSPKAATHDRFGRNGFSQGTFEF